MLSSSSSSSSSSSDESNAKDKEEMLYLTIFGSKSQISSASSSQNTSAPCIILLHAGFGVSMLPSVNLALISFVKDFGGIQILVNNAGITRDQLAMRMKSEEWTDVIDTNLSAVFRLSQAVLRPMMKARSGRIINITSIVGHMGNPGQANYAAAKAGVSGMTRALAREIGSRNITVNCVAPGFIDTDMTRALSEEQQNALKANIPLARLGTPEDVAQAVAFLASPAAAYITGNTLHVNGGLYLA